MPGQQGTDHAGEEIGQTVGNVMIGIRQDVGQDIDAYVIAVPGGHHGAEECHP